MYLPRNTETRSCNHCCSGKAVSVTHSEFVFVAFSIQNTKRMRRIMMSYVACSVLSYCPTLSHKRHDFRKRNYRI